MCAGSHISTGFDGVHSVGCFKCGNMLVDEASSTLSYTRGPDRPLLELTIGDLLDRTASRYPDGLAVASRHQSKRMTWAELSDAADQRCARVVVARDSARRSRGLVVDQLHRVDHDAHGLRTCRRRAGECKSRISLPRTAIHPDAFAYEGCCSCGTRTSARITKRFWAARATG